ncbi:MAG TPA: protein kinase [Candidatus Limnocylindrales bacterium]|nr:protein kinase [Candidatus Limnocylindrales bacterium]
MTEPPRPLPGDAPAEPDPMLGRTLVERYRIDQVIARGGMARVYRARDERLERDVAVKVLSPPYADDPDFTARFLHEARAAASLSHPSLVHVYDSGSDGAAHFIVMELLDEHRTLRDILDSHGPLSRDEVLRIGRELLAGLRVVHERGLVHCDVKAGNVMLGPGPAKLIDFGIAQAPHDGLEGDTSIGSLQYMSPEQLHGDALTPASDLFSLGAVLYEALTGRVPYPGGSPTEVSEAHRSARVRPPSTFVPGVPGRLDDAILQALRREPASRFRTADAMDRALEAAARDQRPPRDDDTRVVRSPGPPPPPAGYVPPRVAAGPPPEGRPRGGRHGNGRRRPESRRPVRRRSMAGVWGALGTLLVLAAAGLVVAFVVVPLIDLGRNGGGAGDPTESPTEVVDTPAPAPGRVIVPDTVGMPTAEAIAAASEAGLNWTVRCAQDPRQPEGIIDQEPAAGAEVAPGSAFTMYSARIQDCR